jgi:hypothetical protein
MSKGITKNRRDLDLTLPVLCGARNPATGEPIAIKRGELGYYPWTASTPITPEQYNALNGINEARVQAMMCGSMAGWDSIGANESYMRQALEKGRERMIREATSVRKRWSKN